MVINVEEMGLDIFEGGGGGFSCFSYCVHNKNAAYYYVIIYRGTEDFTRRLHFDRYID